MILSVLHFIPMLFFSLMLFRLRLKPYWKQLSLAIVAGSVLTANNPLLFAVIICILLIVVWKYRFVPALLMALSGYVMCAFISTTVIVSLNSTQSAEFLEMRNNPVIVNATRAIVVVVKFGILFGLYKFRLGFTFLSNYTKIPLVRENIGVYLFIIVVLLGLIYRHSYPASVYSVAMPIQMLSMAVILFLYTMLGKELSFQR
ncbi:hypothetical protein [Paenibacillus qinlingensis]|uniref:hypothetical protein n=1 Tax=Paenibacillus qinlingensis TaxID=1837343 RepID=UPI00286E85CE|nr:hypothetical protein [Paenibacillus qinlingensis]